MQKKLVAERAKVWRNLSNLAADISSSWVLADDFNCILHSSERVTTNNLLNADFESQKFVQNMWLCEVKFTGNFYTWRGGNNFSTHSRLDRVLGIFDLINKFPYLTAAVLNHSPLFISFINSFRQRQSKPFKFNNSWPSISGYHHNIDSCFNIRLQESPVYSTIKRLKMIKVRLEDLNGSKQCIRQQCDNIRESNNSLYSQLVDNPHNEFLL